MNVDETTVYETFTCTIMIMIMYMYEQIHNTHTFILIHALKLELN